jgi:hypothetical protein
MGLAYSRGSPSLFPISSGTLYGFEQRFGLFWANLCCEGGRLAVCLDEGFSLQLWGQLRGWFQVLVRWAVGFPPDQGEKSA